MAAAGTFIGEVQRGWQRLLGLSWRGKAVALLILLAAATAFSVCNFVIVPWASQTPRKHVSYQQLLHGESSPTLEVWVEDSTVDFRVLEVRETTNGTSKRVMVALDVRSRSNDSHELSCRLGYLDDGQEGSTDAIEFVVNGTPVNDVDIATGTLAIEAVFLVPETARPTSLKLTLHFSGGVPVPFLPGTDYHGEFVFDP
jgi:hypothetical protein